MFESPGPPDLASLEYAVGLNEIKALGGKRSDARTSHETETALFWADGAGTATPPGHWNMVAQAVGAAMGNSLLDNARLFALLNMAIADAVILSWHDKYRFNLWRPVTAIRLADTDGNELTVSDPSWLPLLPTPPFPEHTSAHSTVGGAASKILALFAGEDRFSFAVGSDTLSGACRSYRSFREAARESARSRVYCGHHFEFSSSIGLAQGEKLGICVWESYADPARREKHTS